MWFGRKKKVPEDVRILYDKYPNARIVYDFFLAKGSNPRNYLSADPKRVDAICGFVNDFMKQWPRSAHPSPEEKESYWAFFSGFYGMFAGFDETLTRHYPMQARQNAIRLANSAGPSAICLVPRLCDIVRDEFEDISLRSKALSAIGEIASLSVDDSFAEYFSMLSRIQPKVSEHTRTAALCLQDFASKHGIDESTRTLKGITDHYSDFYKRYAR